MQIERDISLKPYNTFGIDVKAKQFISVSDEDELREVLAMNGAKFILGGGSNMLLTKDVDALVVHVNLKGISVLEENKDEAILRAMAGENWHNLVQWTLRKGFGGLENLSLIPGNTGTAPIQNIGAYGVELKDVFVGCRAMEISTGKIKHFSKEACAFGYRDSIFKREARGKYVILSVDLRLSKRNHQLHMDYGAIAGELERMGVEDPGIMDVSKAVIAIRKSKLPDPAQIGNSGSFFKNPVLDKTSFTRFINNHPEAPFYKISDTEFKVPAGWLIEKTGFKGKQFGNAGVHEKQALVLVNHGGASGQEILELSEKIREQVWKKFGIRIEPEVNII